MAKKRRRSGKKSTTIPLGIVAGVAPGIIYGIKRGQSNGWEEGVRSMLGAYTGYHIYADGTGHWSMKNLWRGGIPMIIGMAVHWAGKRFGINRALGAARIPLLRI